MMEAAIVADPIDTPKLRERIRASPDATANTGISCLRQPGNAWS